MHSHTSTTGHVSAVKVRRKLSVLEKKQRMIAILFCLPALLFIFGFFAYPILYNIFIGFLKMDAQAFIERVHNFNGIENYRAIFSQPELYKALGNTFIFTFFSIIFQFSIGFVLAVLLNRSGFAHVIRGALLTPWLVPLVASASVWVWLMSASNGVFNYLLNITGIIEQNIPWLSQADTALMGAIIVNIWIGIPFCMVLLHSGLQSVPNELYESAHIDGANAFQRNLYITLPMLKEVSAIIILLGIVYGIRIFDLVWILTKGGPAGATEMLGTLSYKYTFVLNEYGLGSAVSNVMLVISISVGLLYLKFTKPEH